LVKAELERRLPREELASFISSIPHVTFFQTPTWIESLEAAFGAFHAAWLTVRGRGELAGVMPVVRIAKGPFSYLWSLPFGTYGDPITRDESVREALLKRFFEMARSSVCLEAGVNLFFPASRDALPREARVRAEECRIVALDGGFEEVWRTAWSSKRRQLARRAEDAGVAVRLLESEQEVRRFHDIYTEESRPWGGVHPYPLALFLELFKRRSEGVFVWGAFMRGELFGGHIDFCYGDMAQAWQGGMAKEAKEFEAGALLIKKAMEEACARGCRAFNLGSSGGNEGIIFFKESLGGREYAYAGATMQKRWWKLIRGRGRA
jgi:CelD/BcsL family acetyltransferase involved in cellulose biosynthesis